MPLLNSVVIPRESGVSSTPRLLGSIIDVSGILDHPLSRVMTAVFSKIKVGTAQMRPGSPYEA